MERLAALIAASPHNLVARGDRPHVLDRHIRECDELARRLQPTGRWLDLGTGGGLPGLVLAWRHEAVSWTLLDATRKKVDAVTSFADALGLRNVRPVWGRAEDLARTTEHRGRYDGVVARAVAPLPRLAALARGFLCDGGLLVAVKGPTWRDEVDAAGDQLGHLALTIVSTEILAIPARTSWVVTMRADGPPPPGAPGAPREESAARRR